MTTVIEHLYAEYEKAVESLLSYYFANYDSKTTFLKKFFHNLVIKNHKKKDIRQVHLTFKNKYHRVTDCDEEVTKMVVGLDKLYHAYDIETIKYSISKMSDIEMFTIKSVLRACVEGPFVPESEFHTLTGLTREEMAEIYMSWPKIDEDSTGISLAINNAFNALLYYPHKKQAQLKDYIPGQPDEMMAVFLKWRELTNRNPTKKSEGNAFHFFE